MLIIKGFHYASFLKNKNENTTPKSSNLPPNLTVTKNASDNGFEVLQA